MYYRLKEPWAFRGWRKAPYAIRAENGDKALDRPLFFTKRSFIDLLCCNGVEDVDLALLTEGGVDVWKGWS